MSTFNPITSKPNKSDQFIYLYNNSSNNGKSCCISGKPTDSECNVLPNCVGWACGRFNHIYNLITGYSGIKYPAFCCNAEKFIEIANQYGLSVGDIPKPGAIMVWRKGATLDSCDGSGHVAIVEKVVSGTEVLTSESGYNSFVFKNITRSKGDGNWTSNESYHFRGFIYNPAVDTNTCNNSKTSENLKSENTYEYVTHSSTIRNYYFNQIKVNINNLRVRNRPSLKGKVVGLAEPGYYSYIKTRKADKFVWYKLDNNKWIAYSSEWAELLQAIDPSNDKIEEGSLVRLTSDATVYGTDKRFSSWVYNISLYVRSINKDKVTISIYMTGDITGVVSIDKLTKIKNKY